MRTNNFVINTIGIYNISLIVKKHLFIIFLLIFNLKSLSENYIYADFSNGILSFYVHFLYFKLNIFINENLLRIVVYASIFLIIFNAILTLVLMKFNDRKEVNFKEETKSKLEVIRKQLSIPSWVVMKVPYSPTAFSYLNVLYVPISLLLEYPNDKVKFIIKHELTHLKSLDSFFNIVDKSYSFTIAFLIASSLFIRNNYIDYLFSVNDIIIFFVKLLLFVVIIYLFSYFEFTPTRFKEHICDFNASRNLKDTSCLKQMLIESNNTKSIGHPTLAQRYSYIFQGKIRAKSKLFIYEIFSISILIVLFNNFPLQLVYGFYFFIILYIIIFLRVVC